MLLSAAARSEFQAIQFIPLLLIPQILFAGALFPIEAIPLSFRPISDILPLTYAARALQDILLRGWVAAANSPTLRQAVSDVEAAKGNLIQAKTYPNPVLSYLVDPSNNNSTAGVQGGAIEQIIKTGGKQKLGVAAAQKDLDNAVLALKRARSDLSTAVRPRISRCWSTWRH